MSYGIGKFRAMKRNFTCKKSWLSNVSRAVYMPKYVDGGK
jgi:hypothetical protein